MWQSANPPASWTHMKCETGVWKTAAFALWWSKTTTVHWHRSGERHQITTYHCQDSELMLTHLDTGAGGRHLFLRWNFLLHRSVTIFNWDMSQTSIPKKQWCDTVRVSQFGLAASCQAGKQMENGLISFSSVFPSCGLWTQSCDSLPHN